MFPAHVFKAYDIRGLAGSELTADFAFALGQAFVVFLREETGKSELSVVVAHDMRLSSPELFSALKDGLQAHGVQILDAGMLSTPSFYFATTFSEADGGIIVTASHNPGEYNGFKVVRANGVPVAGGSGIEKIQELMNSTVIASEAKQSRLQSNGIAAPPAGLAMTQLDGILEKEAQWSLSQAKTELPKLKIVADTANAMGAQYLDAFFEKIDADVVRMNWELDGTFPAHEADPFKDKNVEDLQKRIVQEGADLGIATDGDGDRIFFFDETGARVQPHVLRAILSENVLRDHPGSKICYDIRPGKITPDKISEAGGTPIKTRVGHSLIKAHAIEEGATFAGESSGHMFFWYKDGFFEIPMLVIVKFLEEIAISGKKVSELCEPYNKYVHSGEINFNVEDKQAVFSKLEEKFSDACLEHIDGLTVEYPDYWFNVRASNTESKMRLNMEAENKELLDQKVTEVSAIMNS